MPGAGPRITQGWATPIVFRLEAPIECFIGIDVSQATFDIAALPDGECWTVTHGEHGLAVVAQHLVALAPLLIVLEATGGMEMLAALTLATHGLPMVVVNPRQVRDFAKAIG